MDKTVEGKVVLVTGSADGLGFSMVEHFLKNSAKFVIIVDINETKGMESLDTLKSEYGKDRAVFFPCNVITDLNKTYAEVTKIWNVDVLINNAGICDEKSITNTMNVNAIAFMEWTMKFLEYMRIDKGGKGGTIINISSIYGYRISAYSPYYHASKFAILGFSKSIGHEYNFKRTGVRIITACPGFTTSNMIKNAIFRDEDIQRDQEPVEWQDADHVGKSIVEVFEKADSGSVWQIEGGRPAEKINV